MDSKREVRQPMNATFSRCLPRLEEFDAQKEGDKKQLHLQASCLKYTSSNKNVS